MSLKILHTADVHLGLKFSRYGELGADLADARFRTLEALVHAANEEGCHIFACAGDLFERVTVARQDIRRCAEILNSFEGNVVLVLPGNHDYFSADSELWSRFAEDAGDRVLLLDEARPWDLNHHDLSAVIYPGPCNSRHSSDSAIGWISEEPRDEEVSFHIGIAHGNLAGYGLDDERQYYPMTREELLECNLDLWLLGHVHVRSPSEPNPNERIYYSGIPEPDGFNCRHGWGAWILDLEEDKRITSLPLETGEFRFLHSEAQIRSQTDLNSTAELLIGQANEKTLLKLRLTGRVPMNVQKQISKMRSTLEGPLAFLELDRSDLATEITVEMIDREFTEGSFPHRLLGLLAEDESDQEALQLAYDLLQEVRT